MNYAEDVDHVAECILGKHTCGPDCLCWRLREIPGVARAISRLTPGPEVTDGYKDFVEEIKVKADSIVNATVSLQK